VISDDALARLDSLATSHGIPLIIDGAYGLPFPSMVYTDSNAYWSPNVILMLTLSKLGLPALRTGIIVAREDIVDRFNRASTVMNLATGSFGPVLGARLLRQGLLDRIARDHVGPFYRARSVVAQDSLLPEISGLPCRIHCPDGAMFLWLWCQNLPGGATALYQRLKARGVLVVPGSHFFPGIVDPWAHRDECIRISYAQDDDTIRRGMAVIGDEVRKTYQLARPTPQQENI
jgi:valine--pyruvate aminotransferase